MRWILISLLVLNLAYLGYEFSTPQITPQETSVQVEVLTGVPRIALLSEVKNKIPKAGLPKKNHDQLCWAVGPFPVELDAKHLVSRMLAIDIQADIKPQSVVVKKEFWVYLPPLANKNQAIRKLKELQKRKIDSFVITEGELANGISLGLFSQQESVDRLIADLEKKKVKVSIKEIERSRDEFFVLTPIDERNLLDESTRKRLLNEKTKQWSQIRCDWGLPKT